MIRWFWRATKDMPSYVVGAIITFLGVELLVVAAAVIAAVVSGAEAAAALIGAGTVGLIGNLTVYVVREHRQARLLAVPYADREGYRDEWRP